MTIHPSFIDHAVVLASPDDYVEMTRTPQAILEAWALSMFAHEVLNKDGSVKPETDMADATLEKYLDALSTIKKGEGINKPVLGIGIMDNVEIGIGREIIAACATLGVNDVVFHVRKAQADEIIKLL